MSDLKTLREVMTSDLTSAAHKDALAHIATHCYCCGKPLGEAAAVAVYLPADRDPKSWGVHAYMSDGKIVSPGAFAHVRCLFLAETFMPPVDFLEPKR